MSAKRLCIFCQHPGKITGEHLWSDWFGDLLPRLNLDTGQGFYMHRESLVDGTVNEWHTDEPNATINVVCDRCNNGWMARLEAHAARLIGPMAVGNRRTMTLRQQGILAAWITMKVMVGEFAFSGYPPFFTDAERATFRRTHRPPYPIHIWLGQYTSIRAAQFTDLHLEMPPPDGTGPRVHGYVFSYSIGHFACQAFTHHWRGRITYGVPGLNNPTHFPIWPPERKQAWPPAVGMNQATFDEFVDRWKRLEWPARQP